MPKNKGKGGKNRRRGKTENEEKRELTFKEFGQEYAQVTKTLGGGNMEVHCFDGQKRIGHIRGKLRKKIWINPGDVVLVGVRDFEDGKVDIIQKYTPDEARSLKSLGEIPDTTTINENERAGDTEVHFEFDEDEIDDI